MSIRNLSIAMIAGCVVGLGALFLPDYKEVEKRGDVLQVNVAENPYLIMETLSSLREVIENRMFHVDDINPSPGLRSMRFGDVFQKLKEQGKSIEEEVAAVREFEKAMDDLSEAIRKLREVSTF